MVRPGLTAKAIMPCPGNSAAPAMPLIVLLARAVCDQVVPAEHA